MMPDKYSHCVPPAFLKHKRKDGFHPVVKVAPEIIKRLDEIKRLDFEFSRFLLNPSDAATLITDAMASNIHFSTELEGNPIGIEEVRRITRTTLGGTPPHPQNQGQQEIINHLLTWTAPEMLRSDKWDLDFVRFIHAALLGGVDDDANPGTFTKKGAVIEEDGKVVFEGAPPAHVEPELAQLLDWLNTQAPAFHPTIAATVFFHEFESIHPFDDGNGRVGRTLFHLYLQSNGLPNSKLCFIEKNLLRDKMVYFTLLAWTDHAGSYSELVDYASESILWAYKEAETRLRGLDLPSSGLDVVSSQLLVGARRIGRKFKVSEAATWVEGLSEDTIRRRLNAMVESKILDTSGATRSKVYWFRDPLVAAVDRERPAQEGANA